MDFAADRSGLILPANIADRPACGICFLCRTEFTTPRDLERHMVRCVKDNEQRIREEISPRQGPQDPANWDVEYEQWASGGEKPWQNWYDEHRIQRTDGR